MRQFQAYKVVVGVGTTRATQQCVSVISSGYATSDDVIDQPYQIYWFERELLHRNSRRKFTSQTSDLPTCNTESSPCPKSKRRAFHKTRLSTLSKRRPSSPNTAPATQNDLQNHLSCWPTPANESATPATRMKKCRMSCTHHAKLCFRSPNVPDVPRLPHEMDIAQKTSTAR